MIHLLKDQAPCNRDGSPNRYGSHLIVQTCCGATLVRKTTERLEGATVWNSKITCPECRPELQETG